MFELTFFKKLHKKHRISFKKNSNPKRFYSSKFKPPELPVLSKIANKFSPDMRNTAIFALQHMLPTTASLFDNIVRYFNCSPQNIHCTGKFYSTCPEVEEYMIVQGFQLTPTKPPKKPSQYYENMQETIENMWEKFYIFLKENQNIEKVIILDEGGHCLKYMPKFLPYRYKVACIEQTRFGFYDTDPHSDAEIIPLIDVARSAAKKKLESRLIAETIIARIAIVMKELEINKDKVCGVVGNGAIGLAVTQYLLSAGYTVIAYDESNSAFPNLHNCSFYRVDSMKKVIAGADIVFGCTGKDISKDMSIFNAVKQTLPLISCTFENIEFLTLVKKATKAEFLIKHLNENLSQLQYGGENRQVINILESGFPIIFDRTSKSDPMPDMELTRALLFCAVIQAFLTAKKPIGDGYTINRGQVQMLDPNMQKFVVRQWIANQPKNRYAKQEIDCFNNINWIVGNSSGDYEKNDIIDSHFMDIEETLIKTEKPNFPHF